jgi:protein O-GlcNAc transferase
MAQLTLAKAYDLAIEYHQAGRLDGAEVLFRKIIARQPAVPETHLSLGNVLQDKGQLDEAIAAFRQAMALRPTYAQAHSNLLIAMQYHPGYDAQAIADEYRRWNHQHAHPLRKFIQPHANDRRLDRRLRIGYVSPDFCSHPVGRFMLPLLASHDRTAFEVFCYTHVQVPDEMTAKLRACADTWRTITGQSDEEVSDMIRRDGIDILVDLAMHTAHDRLRVFARKPAPVQATYLAYAGGTGVDTINFRLTDRCLDPDEADDRLYLEHSIRLDGTYWCYHQVSGTPPVSDLPALLTGNVTLGCLNSFCKVNDAVLSLWADILTALPRSRLLLVVPQGSSRQRTLERLQNGGIGADRVEFAVTQQFLKYLEGYHRIDIALDTFPYCGGTTTCDALWMGVPVVTLAGRTAVGRAGVSLLTNAGLPELIARTPQEYARLAVRLAEDLPRLQHLRSTLRRRMEQSPLMDAPRFAHTIEAAYRQMWAAFTSKPPA